MDILLIGVAGGSASGKSHLTKKLRERFGEHITVILQDDYYKAHDNLTYEERAALNYDAPDAFDNDRMIRDLTALKEGREITAPVYDYTIHNRSKEERHISPTRVIIVEGILVFADPALCELFDLKLFVDVDADVRIIRRIRRDMIKRARTLDSIIEQYLATVKPMHDLYVEPSKKNADIIIPFENENPPAVELIIQKIRDHIETADR